MLESVSVKNFEFKVLRHPKPVVVDVWADWCGPCKALAPNFLAASKALEGKAKFVKLDADKNQKLVKRYKVMGIPTLLFFKHGKLVDRKTGVISKNAIIKKVKPLLELSASEAEKDEIKGFFNWKFWKKWFN